LGLADIALQVGAGEAGDTEPANIIEFVESEWGLNTKLYPVQRIILKAHYGIPLDDTDACLPISDWRRENTRMMTEAEYLRFPHSENRCNISEVKAGDERRRLILSIGRRSGKTFISACIVAYEVYKLILKGNPQRHYGVTSDIGFVSVATGKEQAGLLYNEASNHFAKCAFFHPYTANNTQTYAKFQSPSDIKKFGRYKDDPAAKATIKVTFASCIAKGLRGPGNMLIIFDELAHFNTVGQSDAKTVWDAITPSVATFSPKDPDDKTLALGPVEGRIIAISSPLGRQGFFYHQFQLGFQGGKVSQEMLCIQAPTWEVNPTIPESWFEVEYASDPSKFFTEYGADFADQSRNWIEREADLTACIDLLLRPKTQAPTRMPHFAGIDLGLVNDGTALAIGHIDEEKRIVLDWLEIIKAGEGKYKDVDRLDLDEVADWIYQMSRKFYLVEGMFDMWAGIPFEQALIKRGLRQFKATPMTKNKLSEFWRNAKDMMWDQRLVLFDWPIEEGHAHCDYIQELLDLVATYHSKYVTTVEAPQVIGKHDDRSDALVRMIWLASQNLGKPKYMAGPKNGGRGSLSSRETAARRTLKKTLRSGSSPDRRVPRRPGRLTRGRF
jgi:hypothetical protein